MVNAGPTEPTLDQRVKDFGEQFCYLTQNSYSLRIVEEREIFNIVLG